MNLLSVYLGQFNLLASFAETIFNPKGFFFWLIVCIAITIIIVILVKVYISKQVKYSVKEEFLTPTERLYYKEFQTICSGKYIVLPQINLATVINKDSSGYRSELFRNIDFCVFDFNFSPMLLIEINDDSHLREDRKLRDQNVAKICRKAKMPLVAFWVKDGINTESIRKTLAKYL